MKKIAIKLILLAIAFVLMVLYAKYTKDEPKTDQDKMIWFFLLYE